MPLFLSLWFACAPAPQPSAPQPTAPQPTAPEPSTRGAELPPVAHTRPTTRGEMAVDSLNARVVSLYEALPRVPDSREALLGTLGRRVSLLGRVSDLDRMFEVAGEGPLRARALLAVHRFDDALAADPSVAESVALARHEGLDALVTSRRQAAEKDPSAATWQALGDALSATGATREADAAYWASLQAYRDVSPLQVADVQFRRGLLWGESGEDPARARALYTDAVERLPAFVRAHVHLAELEWQAGEKSAAIARVRGVADAEDPEPGGKLAVWLEGEEAAVWKERTVRRYDALLASHPLAFADHAAEFFIAVGDLPRAAELARRNLDNRRTPRAVELCARAGCDAPVP